MADTIKKQDLIDIIEQALYNDELSIFAGAGLSVGAGYCDWKTLLQEPAAKLKLDIDKEENDLISLAQFYYNTNNRNVIDELLLRSFSCDKEPTVNHKILSQLPITTYWTTNYDSLIEDALRSNNKKVSVRRIDKDLQLSYRNYDSVVYKMHGDIQRPSEAVITRDDYEEYGINSRRLFRDVLEGALLTKTFLFIGFSFSDPNFIFVLSKMRVLLGEHSRLHYYILKRISKPKKENFKEEKDYDSAMKDYNYNLIKQNLRIADLSRYGIKIYLIDHYEEITEILEIILARYRRRTIFISGSAEEYESLGKEISIELIRKLSFELVKNGYKVVNGYGLGFGTYVINGVTEYCYENKNIKVEDRLKLMPFPLSAKNCDKLRETWEKYREEMISGCGIALFMFGNKNNDGKIVNADGLKKEFNIAKSKDLINIPLAFTGYMSQELFDENINDIEKILTAEEVKYIREFHDLDTNVKEIIKIINKLNNKEE